MFILLIVTKLLFLCLFALGAIVISLFVVHMIPVLYKDFVKMNTRIKQVVMIIFSLGYLFIPVVFIIVCCVACFLMTNNLLEYLCL